MGQLGEEKAPRKTGKSRETRGEWSSLGKKKHPRKAGKRGKPVVSGAAWGRGSTPESRKKRETSGEWGSQGK